MAEVYLIGQIHRAENFVEPNLFCKYSIQAGSLWKFVEGEFEGQTATDCNRIDQESIFSHPIDLHLACRGIQGWPKIHVEVFSVNSLKQFYPVGVGFAFIPSKPGFHRIKISTWKIAPLSFLDSIKEKFYTGGLTIVKKDLIYSGIERYKISTISSGVVEVELNLVFLADDNSTNSSPSTTPSVLNVTTISSLTTSNMSSTTALPLPSTSTPAPKEDSLNMTKQEVFKTMTTNRTQLLNTTSYNCNCDITLNSCDVNCCCDIDCSHEIMTAFYCGTSETNIGDYYQGGLEHCDINNGLFCIARDNLGSPDYYLNVAYHDEYESYKWYQESTEDVQQKFEIVNEFYKFGDEVLTFDPKSEKIDVLLLAATLTDTTCHVHVPVKFLKSKTVKCLKSINEILNYNDNLTKRLLNVQLFRRPLKTLTAVREGDLLNVTIITCKHSLDNCTNFVFNETSTDDLNVMEADDELYQEIFILIGINDTIILNVTAYFISYDTLVLNSDLLLEDHTVNIIQKIEVKFENYHKSPENLIRKRIRGYNIEEQILASQYRPLNESATILENVLDYFRNDSHQNTNDYVLKLPESRNGQCVLNGKIFDQIRFNENTHSMCKVNFNLDGKLNNSTCQIMQSHILHFLIPMMNLTANNTDNFWPNMYVSKNWSPQFHINSWKRIDLNNVPAFNPEVQENEKFLTCNKIPTTISYKIYSTRMRSSGTRKYENVIEKVEADFGNLQDIKLYEDVENQTVKIELNVHVQFFNLHSKLHLPNNANEMFIGFGIIICSLFALKIL